MSEATITTTIESVNKIKSVITLKSLAGKTLVTKVEEPKLLENVKGAMKLQSPMREHVPFQWRRQSKRARRCSGRFWPNLNRDPVLLHT